MQPSQDFTGVSLQKTRVFQFSPPLTRTGGPGGPAAFLGGRDGENLPGRWPGPKRKQVSPGSCRNSTEHLKKTFGDRPCHRFGRRLIPFGFDQMSGFPKQQVYKLLGWL